jgi:hypothetical protein
VALPFTVSLLGCFREIGPLAGNFKPRFLMKLADCPLSLLLGFLGLLAKSSCFVQLR